MLKEKSRSAEKSRAATPDPMVEIARLREKCSQLEDENLELRSLYDSILDGITVGVWVADRDNVIYYVNKGMEMISGTTQQKVLGSCILRDFPEETIGHFRKYYTEAMETLQPVYYPEVDVITPAGRQTYQSGWLIPKVKDGRFDGMVCTIEDITNRKQAEKALSRSEAKYQELVENVNSIIMRMDMEGHITFFNRFSRKFFGFNEDEIVGKNVVGTIVPNTKRNALVIRRMLREIQVQPERYANREFENATKAGDRVWVAWTLRPLFNEEGRVTEILCAGVDITEHKYNESLLRKCRNDLEEKVKLRTLELTKANENLQQEIREREWAEEVVRSSEKKYRLVVENANEGIVIVQDGFLKYLNPKAAKIMGHDADALRARPFFEFVHPDDKDMVTERHLKRLRGDLFSTVYSYRIIDRDGNIKWVEINAVLITWMGRPATLAFFNNITERKRAEEMLHLLETAIQQAKDSIIITTANPGRPSSRIVFVNPAFTRMTGYTPDDVIGKPSLILQSPWTDNTEWLKLETSRSKEKAFYVETVARRKDGSQFSLEWQIAPLRDEKGKVTHFVSIQRDITERKAAEEQFRTYQEQLRSLASALSLAEERERRRIATDLHDHIGQTLAITKMKLGALRNALQMPEHHAQIDDIRAFVEQTIQYTKSLTFELSPPILYELGFEATIEWLGERVQKEHYILFELEDDGKPKPLDKDVSVLMFQAVRELFMNIVKHAQAHYIHVSISREGERMQISVEDDGLGFDASRVDKTTSYGFFSIHERLRYFGGTFALDTNPGSGTKVTLTCPLMAGRKAGDAA